MDSLRSSNMHGKLLVHRSVEYGKLNYTGNTASYDGSNLTIRIVYDVPKVCSSVEVISVPITSHNIPLRNGSLLF
jgi:hypothetical protein